MLSMIDDVLKVIDDNMDGVRHINCDMYIGMTKARDLVEKLESKKVDAMGSMERLVNESHIKMTQLEIMEQWAKDPD